MTRALCFILFLIGSLIFSFYLNGVITDILIPNPCAFHQPSVEVPFLVKTFYSFRVGHPTQNTLNVIITLSFAVGLAWGVHRLIFKRNKKKELLQ